MFLPRTVFNPDLPIANKRERAMHLLQTSIAPNIFHPRGVYDGKRLLYLSHTLNLPGGGGAARVSATLLTGFSFLDTSPVHCSSWE
jgi:hypothetical protein